MSQQRLELHLQHHGPLQTSTELTLPPLMALSLPPHPRLASLVKLITKMTWLPLLLASGLGLTLLHSVYLAEKSRMLTLQVFSTRKAAECSWHTSIGLLTSHQRSDLWPLNCTNFLCPFKLSFFFLMYISQSHAITAGNSKNWLTKSAFYLMAAEISV